MNYRIKYFSKYLKKVPCEGRIGNQVKVLGVSRHCNRLLLAIMPLLIFFKIDGKAAWYKNREPGDLPFLMCFLFKKVMSVG